MHGNEILLELLSEILVVETLEVAKILRYNFLSLDLAVTRI